MEKKQNNKAVDPKRKGMPGIPPEYNGKSAIVWLMVFLLVGVLIIYRFGGLGAIPNKEFDQSTFLDRAIRGEIITASIQSDPELILNISGKFRLSKEELASLPESNRPADGMGVYRTTVLKSDAVDEVMRIHIPDVRVETPGLWKMFVWMLPTLLILGVIFFLISRQYKMAGKGAMQFGKSRARMIPPDELHVTFDDIAGADEAKEEIKEIVDFLKDPLKFTMVGGKIPKGCLLTGQPGTGKTLLAKAVACEANVPFFAISGSDFVEMFVGVGASRVRDMFEQARHCSPSLIFIDEIDAVGRSRFTGMGGGHDEREQTLNAMLVEMDGLESSQTNVIVIAATNRPDVLDPALLRPGRFDRQIVMDLPDIAGRRKILDIHGGRIRLAPDVDLDTIARVTPGFSGADLANLCNEAALLCARNNREQVTQADLEEARDKVCWGRERKSRHIPDQERKLTAYHEAGHTIVGLCCDKVDDIHKVTIVPRGRALGATFTLPENDRYSVSKQEILDDLAFAMGGRAAEELIFGDITGGAAGDIIQASKQTRQLVCTYGMDETIGPVNYSGGQHPLYVAQDDSDSLPASQETLREIDLAVKRYIEEAIGRARAILKEHKAELEKLAEALLERETLSAHEIYELLGWPDPKAPKSSESQAASGNEGGSAEVASEPTPELIPDPSAEQPPEACTE